MVETTGDQPGKRIGLGHAALVTLFYFLVTMALLTPFSLHLASRALSPGSDWDFTLWLYAWDVHAFLHHPWHIFDANIMAPLPNTLGYEENGIGGALMVAPVIWLTHNVLLAANLAAVLTIPLSGLGVYLLARTLRVSEAGALLAGLVFAFNPPRFFRLEQFHITAIEWIPFCLAFLHQYLDSGRRRDLWIAIAFFSAQALSSGHGTAFLLVSIVALLAYRAILGEPIAIWRRIRDVGMVGVLALLPAFLVYLPYHRARTQAGLERTLQGWFTAPASFLASPSRIDSALATHYPLWLQDRPNAYLFPGYALLAFLVIASTFRRRRGSTTGSWAKRARRVLAVVLDIVVIGYAGAAVLFAWLGLSRIKVDNVVLLTVHRPWRLWAIAGLAAFGRAILGRWRPIRFRWPERWSWRRAKLWRHALRTNAGLFYLLLAVGASALLIGPPYGPWQYLYWIPPLSFIRAPLRFSLLAMLGVAIVAGFALDRCTRRVSRRARQAVAALVGVLCLVEWAAVPIAGIPTTMDVPPIDQWLNTQPKPFTVAEVPLASPGDVSKFNAESARYMVHSTAHFQKTVMGFTGVLPPDHALLYDQLSRFPDEPGLRHLLAFDVTYVVVHGEDYAPDDLAALRARLQTYSGWLTLVHCERLACVYALHPPGGPHQ